MLCSVRAGAARRCAACTHIHAEPANLTHAIPPGALPCPALPSPALPRRRAPGWPRHKVLLGLNFYGYEFVWKGKLLQKAEPVLASRLLDVLCSQGGGGSGSSGGDPAAGQCSEGGSATGSCAAAGGSSGQLRIEWLADAREHLFRWREPVGGGSGSSSGGSSGSSSGGGGSGQSKKRKGMAHRLYFPTPRALAERLAAAQAHGMGAAVWELGQGLDAFCSLL